MKKTLLILMFAFIGITTMSNAKAQTYDPYAVQVINNLIANNGLQATPNAPETWGLIVSWNDKTPKQLTRFQYPFFYTEPKLYGVASFAGLETLELLLIDRNELIGLDITNCTGLISLSCEWNNLSELELNNCKLLEGLSCSGNNLSKLDVTNCKQLAHLRCNNNKLAELNLLNCTQLNVLMCQNNCLTKIDLPELENPLTFLADEQSVSLILYENEDGEYTLPISLNNPSFGNSAISYSDGMLKSNDKTVTSTSFRVTTGEYYNRLNGTMYFNYSNIGVNEIDCEGLRVYPNPATGELIINNYELRIINVEIYDVNGRKQKAESRKQNSEGEMVVDISHLPAGVYLVKVFTEQGEITKKIVKQ